MTPTSVDLLRMHFISRLAVPSGQPTAIRDVPFLMDKTIRQHITEEAEHITRHSIEVVRQSPDNQLKTDEEIAKAILEELEKKDALRSVPNPPSDSTDNRAREVTENRFGGASR